ncbi:MAG: glycosyltransferase [Muribaculaceae bacterium]|nr:glycosyltransferase [Muribaculaceae bacterium]MDE7143330.1 glycosyltransferase [Muribaculaceae bacterium]
MNKPQLIVSLTSFPKAINYATQAIRSILDGSLLPDRVVLYLAFSDFDSCGFPQELLALAEENPRVELRDMGTDIRSYGKLIPALKEFPDDVIVTIDDDIRYHRHMLRDLVKLHKKLPEAIIAHRVRRLRPDEPYSKWRKYKWHDFIFRRHHFSHHAMQTGAGGVLYPPHSLDATMLDPTLFLELAPTTDDIWFWAAAVANGTYVVPLPNGKSALTEVGKPRELSLKTTNLRPGDDRNRQALDRIFRHFPLIRQKLSEEEKRS